jgi:hypothetical protein
MIKIGGGRKRAFNTCKRTARQGFQEGEEPKGRLGTKRVRGVRICVTSAVPLVEHHIQEHFDPADWQGRQEPEKDASRLRREGARADGLSWLS